MQVEKPPRAQESSPAKLVGDALVQHVAQIDHDVCDAGDEDSFFVADLGEVKRAFCSWTAHLPAVTPYYAVKCNTDRAVVRMLGELGANFDCASPAEIDMVLELGFDASRIVYANPCKTNSFLRHARDRNVALTTVDNAHELRKIHRFHPQCAVLIRLATDDASAQCRLSTKFGCSVESAVDDLLPLCRQLGLDVAGVAFHMGSGAREFGPLRAAIRDARTVFDRALELGFSMSVLDIGGGFERRTFAEAAAAVHGALHQHFPPAFVEQHRIRFMAEPGRFMVAEAFTLATHVIARREVHDHGVDAMVYINDGVYGNLNCIIFDHQHPTARVLKHGAEVRYGAEGHYGATSKHVFSLWGPTCDGLDCVAAKSVLDADVQVGDWLYFSNVGAYTMAALTAFNGFRQWTRVVYVDSAEE